MSLIKREKSGTKWILNVDLDVQKKEKKNLVITYIKYL